VCRFFGKQLDEVPHKNGITKGDLFLSSASDRIFTCVQPCMAQAFIFFCCCPSLPLCHRWEIRWRVGSTLSAAVGEEFGCWAADTCRWKNQPIEINILYPPKISLVLEDRTDFEFLEGTIFKFKIVRYRDRCFGQIVRTIFLNRVVLAYVRGDALAILILRRG